MKNIFLIFSLVFGVAVQSLAGTVQWYHCDFKLKNDVNEIESFDFSVEGVKSDGLAKISYDKTVQAQFINRNFEVTIRSYAINDSLDKGILEAEYSEKNSDGKYLWNVGVTSGGVRDLSPWASTVGFTRSDAPHEFNELFVCGVGNREDAN